MRKNCRYIFRVNIRDNLYVIVEKFRRLAVVRLKKQIVGVIIENDGYVVKDAEGISFNKVMPRNIYKIPNIPFYHSAWNYYGDLIKPEIAELRECIKSTYGKIGSCNGLIAIPADSLPVDIRMIEETFQILGLPKSMYVSKTSLLAINGVSNYIALSVSERLVILEWYRNGQARETIFYNKSAVNRNKLFNDIGNIRYKQNDNNLNLFIFDGENELTELYDIGQVISVPEMVEMLNDASRIVFDPAYIKRMKANKSNK